MSRELDREELEGKMQVFPEAFHEYFNQPMNKQVLKDFLTDLLKKREIERIESAFGSLSPRSIKLLLAMLDEKPKELIANNLQQARKSSTSSPKAK